MRVRPFVAAAALGLAILAGCSSQPEPTATPSISAAASDVTFAQMMIPHHEQAVQMADLALASQSGASPQVKALAEQIKAAQAPEIAQMDQWLTAWGAGPMTEHGGHSMPGMMSDEQLQELSAASGTEFDEMWLTMMVDHHRGAIEMAEQAQGSADPQVAAMAETIMAAQQDEIITMRGMLGGQ